MSQTMESGGELGVGPEKGGAEQERGLLLRKSCDLCVRLKRACDGKSPCHLCDRRRENCTRSVKRKSGPAKGTKYTTRRQRLEAGIVDNQPPKARGSRGRATSSSKSTSTSATVTAAGTVVPPSSPNVTGRRVAARHSIDSSSHQSFAGANTTDTAPSVPSGMAAIPVPNTGDRDVNIAHHRRSDFSPAGQPSVQLAPHNAAGRIRRREVVGGAGVGADLGRGDARGRPGLDASSEGGNGDAGGNSRVGPRGGFVTGSPRGRSGAASNGIGTSGIDNRTTSGTTGVLAKMPASPVSLPALPWPSGGGGSGATSSGGGGGDGADPDHSRGHSTSPLGPLTGRPQLVGKPRRGGTREPPVEASAAVSHFWPTGHPASSRFRMSPPFPGREQILGSQRPEDGGGGGGVGGGGLGSISSGFCERSGGSMETGGQADIFRTVQRDPRGHMGSFSLGGQFFGHPPYPPPTSTGASFTGSSSVHPPLGSAIDDRNKAGGNVDSEHDVDRQQQSASTVASGSTNGASRPSRNERDEWAHSSLRVLPPPVSGLVGRNSQFADDTLMARIEAEEGGNTAGGTRWRGPEGSPGEKGESNVPTTSDGGRWRGNKNNIRSSGDDNLNGGDGVSGGIGLRRGTGGGMGSGRESRDLPAGGGVSQGSWNSNDPAASSAPLTSNGDSGATRSWGADTGVVTLTSGSRGGSSSGGHTATSGSSGGGVGGESADGDWEFNANAPLKRNINGIDGANRGGTCSTSNIRSSSCAAPSLAGEQLGMMGSSPTSTAQKPKPLLTGTHDTQGQSGAHHGRQHPLPSVDAFGVRVGGKNSMSSASFPLGSGAATAAGTGNSSRGPPFNAYRGDNAGPGAGNGSGASDGVVPATTAAANALESFRGGTSVHTWSGNGNGSGGSSDGAQYPLATSHRNAQAPETYFASAEVVSGGQSSQEGVWEGHDGGGRQESSSGPFMNAGAVATSMSRARDISSMKSTPAPMGAQQWQPSWNGAVHSHGHGHGHGPRGGFEREAPWPSEYSI